MIGLNSMMMGGAGGGSGVGSRAVAVAHATSPFLTVYPWSDSSGFGVKYTNPVTLPSGQGNGVAFSKQGDAVAIAHSVVSPRFSVYPFSPITGIGVRYANPATLPTGDAIAVDFHPDGNAIAVGHITSPFISTYPFSVATGIGVRFANPAALPPQNCLGVKFSPLGNYLAVVGAAGTGSSGYRSTYAWSASGFGGRLSHVASDPNVSGVDWHPSGSALATATSQAVANLSPVRAYPVSAGVIGTPYSSAPSSAFGGTGVAFNRAGTAVAVSHEGTPFISAFTFTVASGFGTRFADPSVLATGNGRSVSFSHSDSAIALATVTTPFIEAWRWSNSSGFGAKYAIPSVLPAGSALGVDFCK